MTTEQNIKLLGIVYEFRKIYKKTEAHKKREYLKEFYMFNKRVNKLKCAIDRGEADDVSSLYIMWFMAGQDTRGIDQRCAYKFIDANHCLYDLFDEMLAELEESVIDNYIDVEKAYCKEILRYDLVLE